MYGFLRTPRWLAAIVTVATLITVFVTLGVWQLRRADERRLDNQVLGLRTEAEPQPIDDLLGGAGEDLVSLDYRPATATGRFRPELEVLIRSRVHQSAAGFGVVTPLELSDGRLLLVDRGWVPLELDTPPATATTPPLGEVEVGGLVRLSQTRPPFGPREREGRLDVFVRIDVPRIAAQLPAPVVPVWLQLVDGDGGDLPIPTDRPTFDDAGPHLSYAVQWFGFAAVFGVGFVALVRRAARPRRAGGRTG